MREEENYLYFKEIRRKASDKLTEDEEKDIVKRIEEGDEQAREILIRRNLRFVVKIAKEYQNQGLSMSDLIQAGNYGLVVAIDKFNSDNDNRFISYAVHWIRQKIRDALNKESRPIRLPVNKIIEVSNDDENLSQEEIANKYHIPMVESIHQKFSTDDDDVEMVDTIADEEAHKIDNSIDDNNAIKNELYALLEDLDNDEYFIVTSLYGIGTEQLSLDKIWEEYYPYLSKERVRQKNVKGIRKIRNNGKELFNLLQENF